MRHPVRLAVRDTPNTMPAGHFSRRMGLFWDGRGLARPDSRTGKTTGRRVWRPKGRRKRMTEKKEGVGRGGWE